MPTYVFTSGFCFYFIWNEFILGFLGFMDNFPLDLLLHLHFTQLFPCSRIVIAFIFA